MVHFSPKFKCAVVCDDAKLKPSKNRFEPEASQVLIPFTSWGSQRHKPSVVLPKRALQKRELTHETELCLGLSKQELCLQGEGHSLLNFAHEFMFFTMLMYVTKYVLKVKCICGLFWKFITSIAGVIHFPNYPISVQSLWTLKVFLGLSASSMLEL